MNHYIVSVKHTHRKDLYITLWRPDNKGYCWALSNAGKYDKERVMGCLDYYNSGNDVAVPCEIMDSISVAPVPGHHDNDSGPCIENTRQNWDLVLSNMIAPTKYPVNPEFKGARKKKSI